MATIQVGVRCRPFTVPDELGLELLQHSNDPPTAEVRLLHSHIEGDRARFPFSYAWWSAFNYRNKLTGGDMELADNMKMISQSDVYDAVGHRIKGDLLNGDPVVLFAYGLSGSGKTFTVFGPDAVDSPDAWFKHSTPHSMWGILPNVAYELFREKKDDWQISMKYFQNVVDTVRDLMSNNAQEHHYKQGMRPDPDGFMDIPWCQSKVLHSWADFLNEFKMANARKAISPTQFNHQSTRGHCIMTLELTKPSDFDPMMKQRGRLYVCDLAGTEPAGDIYYAQYKVETDADGNKEYTCIGRHQDQSKTRELQEQGKKINLSLSEMAQFFMKMAEAVMKKTLKPGTTIPGCNSFFLCKYLKATMLQAKTYLFCAVRPEVTFHKYTFATLGFAKNASVIKVNPKKATADMSAAERKLMDELNALKSAMSDLEERNQKLQAAEANTGGYSAEDLESAVAAKVAELHRMQENSVKHSQESDEQQLREQYARQGMALAKLDGDTRLPHFTNLDVERFRDGVFMYILSKPEMSFGPKGDFQPQSLAVVPGHCSVTVSAEGEVAVHAGNGPTYVNGRLLLKDETQVLAAFDRLAVGSELLLLRLPGREPQGVEPPSGESAAEEYRDALVAQTGTAAKEQSYSAALKRIEAGIQMMQPKLAEATQISTMIDPEAPLQFSLSLKAAELTAQSASEDADMRVSVVNPSKAQSITISDREFLQCLSMLNDEMGHMRDAVVYGGAEHIIATENRPAVRFFDHMVHLGTCVVSTAILQHNMDTAADDTYSKIFKVDPGLDEEVDACKLEVIWTPLAGPDDNGSGTVMVSQNGSDLLGKPWTYRLDIKTAVDLPSTVRATYVEYYFLGDRFVTEVQEYDQGTRSPDYAYSYVHHVESVTQDFLSHLSQNMQLKIFATPWVFVPPTGISSNDPGVAERIRPGMLAPELAAAKQEARDLQLQVQEARAKADNESSELRTELSKAKQDRRLMLMKGVVRDLTHSATMTRFRTATPPYAQAPMPGPMVGSPVPAKLGMQQRMAVTQEEWASGGVQVPGPTAAPQQMAGTPQQMAGTQEGWARGGSQVPGPMAAPQQMAGTPQQMAGTQAFDTTSSSYGQPWASTQPGSEYAMPWANQQSPASVAVPPPAPLTAPSSPGAPDEMALLRQQMTRMAEEMGNLRAENQNLRSEKVSCTCSLQ